MLISFLNYVDIQLVLEYKNSFGKLYPIFTKKFLKGVFFGTPCIKENSMTIF